MKEKEKKKRKKTKLVHYGFSKGVRHHAYSSSLSVYLKLLLLFFKLQLIQNIVVFPQKYQFYMGNK